MKGKRIKLDCSTIKGKTGVPFDLEHAKNLLRLEASMGVKNWSITPGQPYYESNGEIITKSSSKPPKDQSVSGDH